MTKLIKTLNTFRSKEVMELRSYDDRTQKLTNDKVNQNT